MMTPAVARRAQELAAQRVPFVIATVVRAQRPTSALAGNVALVLGDGTVEGFIGGVCAEQSVRAYSLQVMETEEAVLLRILPDADKADGPRALDSAPAQDGAITVRNPCLSGGAIEVFLEPTLPGPRVMVVGQTPIASALLRLGGELGLDVVMVDGDSLDPGPGDLALVVASHGRDEVDALERGLASKLPYVGLVASRKRGAGVISELHDDGVPEAVLEHIDVPAGLDIGARSPAEIALSILAQIIAVRRAHTPSAPAHTSGAPAHIASAPARNGARAAAPSAERPNLVVDPICGMTIAAMADTPSLEHDGETIYFCGEGCRARFAAEHEHAVAAE